MAGAIVLQMQRKVYLWCHYPTGEDAPILKSMGYAEERKKRAQLAVIIVIQTQ